MNVYFVSKDSKDKLAKQLVNYISENVQHQIRYIEYTDMIYIGCKYFSI